MAGTSQDLRGQTAVMAVRARVDRARQVARLSSINGSAPIWLAGSSTLDVD